jgi:hypothetical protein
MKGALDIIVTNKDRLIKVAALGEIITPASRGYRPTWDGRVKFSQGGAGIKYNLKVGDLTSGWVSGDHVEPGVIIQGKEKPVPSDTAVALLSCIGNKAIVVSGNGKGCRGVYTGRHAGSHSMCWFNDEDLEKLAIGDKVQVKTWGVGLRIKGFESVKVNKCSPQLLESMRVKIENNKLTVPVTANIPPYLMGSGIGHDPIVEPIDYDIQTTDPSVVEEFELEKLRLGDIVCLTDQLCVYGRGYYPGAVTVGVVVHGFSDFSGHGPGVNPILSTKDNLIESYIDATSNITKYLNLE